MPVISASLQRHAKFDLAEPIHRRIIAFLLLTHYFRLSTWALPLLAYLWPLHKIWTKSRNPRLT